LPLKRLSKKSPGAALPLNVLSGGMGIHPRSKISLITANVLVADFGGKGCVSFGLLII